MTLPDGHYNLAWTLFQSRCTLLGIWPRETAALGASITCHEIRLVKVASDVLLRWAKKTQSYTGLEEALCF